MDRQPHDYAAAMAFAQQQQQQQQQMFGFQRHPQQQFAPHGAAFVPAHTHPSLQHFPFPHHLPPQQLHPHHLLHLQQHQQHQQQQPPPSLGAFPPHHLPPHMGPPPNFHQSLDAMPIPAPAPPPSDPELQKRIDKLVEYAAKNGPEFEAMIRDKQRDNPAYSFLFGADGHSYYRYKLWLTTRPSDAAHFGPIISSPVNPMLNPAALSPVHLGMGAHPLHQGYQSSYDQHQMPPHTQHYTGPGQGEYDKPTNSFKGLSGPLPSDVASELHGVLNSLTGTKESIKGAKMWFMQRSPFAPALAEALKERVFATDDSEKQLHVVFLANDILFDSLQRRISLGDLDNEALAFKPVIGSMLARIYSNPHNKDANQSRLEKILQFWAAKEVYSQDTIRSFESEMTGGALPVHSGIQEAARSFDSSGLQTEAVHASNQWLPDKHQESIPGSIDQQLLEKSPSISQFVSPSTSLQSSMYSSANATHFPGALPNQSPLLAAALQPSLPHLPSTTVGAVEQSKPPPYPLFPPGLIPGMVRKMQIGSGVPYSPMSPLDIPTVIPPSTTSESDILERVSKFFKEVGEATPSEAPMLSSCSSINQNNYEQDEYERDVSVRKGGACIPPPVNLHHLDPETGANAEGSMEQKHGSSSGRLGLGATDDPNEVSQYDDVYSSYRKQRSTNYHSSMSTRSATR